VTYRNPALLAKQVMTLDVISKVIGKYMDAGFGGFTFSNNVLQTEESIALAGELIKVVRGSAVSA
jgi:hypothetical protein